MIKSIALIITVITLLIVGFIHLEEQSKQRKIELHRKGFHIVAPSDVETTLKYYKGDDSYTIDKNITYTYLFSSQEKYYNCCTPFFKNYYKCNLKYDF